MYVYCAYVCMCITCTGGTRTSPYVRTPHSVHTVGSGLSDIICPPHMCQINQVLDKPGRIVYSLVIGIHNGVLVK